MRGATTFLVVVFCISNVTKVSWFQENATSLILIQEDSFLQLS